MKFDLLYEFFIKGDKTMKDILSLLGSIPHNAYELNPGAFVSLERKDAAAFLKQMKNKGYVCYYKYPVEEQAKIVVALDNNDIKKINAKVGLKNYVPY